MNSVPVSRRTVLRGIGVGTVVSTGPTQTVVGQEQPCSYFEITDEQIGNIISYIRSEMDYDDKEETIAILEEVRSGPDKVNIVVYDPNQDKAIYDAGGANTTVPSNFIINLQAVYEQVPDSAEYFNESGNANCDQILNPTNCPKLEVSDQELEDIQESLDTSYFPPSTVDEYKTIVETIIQGPAVTIIYLSESGQPRYDNGDVDAAIPLNLYEYIVGRTPATDGSKQDCEFIAYTETDSRTTTSASTATTTSTSVSTGTPTSTPTPEQADNIDPESSRGFDDFLNQFFISLLSTEALAALSTAVVVVLMVVVWNNNKE